jgi:hypothetical protein
MDLAASSLPFLAHSLDISNHFFVFQADGEENDLQWHWMRLVDCGRGMEFGPVEEAIEGSLGFFAEILVKLFPPSAQIFCGFVLMDLGDIQINGCFPVPLQSQQWGKRLNFPFLP